MCISDAKSEGGHVTACIPRGSSPSISSRPLPTKTSDLFDLLASNFASEHPDNAFTSSNGILDNIVPTAVVELDDGHRGAGAAHVLGNSTGGFRQHGPVIHYWKCCYCHKSWNNCKTNQRCTNVDCQHYYCSACPTEAVAT